LKPERWGSLLVQEMYQEEKACDKRHPYRIIIIIIIIIWTKWLQHINRMPCNRLPRIINNYRTKDRRNQGRQLKRLPDV
jgi:hypothetical protein